MRFFFAAARTCALFALWVASSHAQERYSPFIPTEASDVVRMVNFAGLHDGDVVFDLGSGDGRIVLEAARMKAGVRGRGIEMDGKLVAESTAAAQAGGLAERVTFVHQNAFDADLSDASVIIMWLWPEVMRMLRPKILAQAKPGTRVITRMWDLGTWPPDETATNGTTLYKWIVPAKVAGYWSWKLALSNGNTDHSAIIDQRYQSAEGFVRVRNRRAVLNDMKLSGDDISFSLLLSIEGTKLIRHQFTGKVRGDVIEGTVEVLQDPYDKTVELPWRAERTATSAYFEPTGIELEVAR